LNGRVRGIALYRDLDEHRLMEMATGAAAVADVA
jgi:hypothetical protein